MTLRTAMRFGDFSKNISKPLDRKAKFAEILQVICKVKAMQLKFSTLSIQVVLGDTIHSHISERIPIQTHTPKTTYRKS